MSFVLRRRPATHVPPPGRLVGRNAVTSGLRAFYILREGYPWYVNLVTGEIGGMLAGSGVEWHEGLMRTPGSAGSGILLSTGSASNGTPSSFVYGLRHGSGVVDWSLMANEFTWTGWYHENDTFKTTNANSFDGAITFGGSLIDGVYRCAASMRAENELAGKAFGASRQSDTGANAPSAFVREVALGWSRRSIDDNAALAYFDYFGVFDRDLTSGEQDDLTECPWILFDERIWVPVSAGGAAALAGAGTAGAAGTGALTTAIPIVGAAVASASGTGALSTAISLVGASATVSASGSGNLTTTIRLDGAALASVAGAGALTAQITLSGAALASVVGTGALTTAPAGLAGDATGGATGTGTLTTGIALAGSASVSAIGAGGLVTGIPLAGGATAAVTGSGDLAITLSGLSGAALASVVGGGALLTSITLSGAALASALGSGVLTTIGVETYGIRGVRGAQVQGRTRPAQITRAKRRN